MTDTASRTFDVRHLQMARALFAAIAAVMITFSIDHSAAVGLSVFSGFAIATGLVFFLAVWLVFPAAKRWPAAVLGAVMVLAGMLSGVPDLRTTEYFFILVAIWAFVFGITELVLGILARRAGDVDARESIFVGALTIVLGVSLVLTNPTYQLDYFIPEADRWFSLTGITIGVGLFGVYAAVVAVYLGIAAFSPRPAPAVIVDPADAPGGHA